MQSFGKDRNAIQTVQIYHVPYLEGRHELNGAVFLKGPHLARPKVLGDEGGHVAAAIDAVGIIDDKQDAGIL